MHIQVIQGRTSDPRALKEQLQRWVDEVAPGAVGALGSTFGVTAEGDLIGIARFESAEAAYNNSNRPEQGDWWSVTEKLFDGPVTFHDSTEVDQFLRGGSDDAGFVQVMQGRATDTAKVRALESRMVDALEQNRPDVIGSIRAWYGDGAFTEFVYFTSEAAARDGEAKPLPPEEAALMGELQQVMSIDRFYDLTDLWLFTV